MITLEQDQLIFRFPEVHEEAVCKIQFQRTLRIPDDGKTYPLPPGLGGFPLRHIDDYVSRVPDIWLKQGGVIMPMHQSEAMWIQTGRWRNDDGYPFALKFATGKINAVSGDEWVPHLNQDPQDYVVSPTQPWLDGFCVDKGAIRQFVAMPLGQGYSAGEQITGRADLGGVQIIAYPMKKERYERLKEKRSVLAKVTFNLVPEYGLAPGGRMKQEIYEDPYGLDAWDLRHASRCFVTIANSVQWEEITRERAPTEPPTAARYAKSGLPWFDYYGEDAKTLEGSGVLAGLKSVAAKTEELDAQPLSNNASVEVGRVVTLRGAETHRVREEHI